MVLARLWKHTAIRTGDLALSGRGRRRERECRNINMGAATYPLSHGHFSNHHTPIPGYQLYSLYSPCAFSGNPAHSSGYLRLFFGQLVIVSLFLCRAGDFRLKGIPHHEVKSATGNARHILLHFWDAAGYAQGAARLPSAAPRYLDTAVSRFT